PALRHAIPARAGGGRVFPRNHSLLDVLVWAAAAGPNSCTIFDREPDCQHNRCSILWHDTRSRALVRSQQLEMVADSRGRTCHNRWYEIDLGSIVSPRRCNGPTPSCPGFERNRLLSPITKISSVSSVIKIRVFSRGCSRMVMFRNGAL